MMLWSWGMGWRATGPLGYLKWQSRWQPVGEMGLRSEQGPKRESVSFQSWLHNNTLWEEWRNESLRNHLHGKTDRVIKQWTWSSWTRFIARACFLCSLDWLSICLLIFSVFLPFIITYHVPCLESDTQHKKIRHQPKCGVFLAEEVSLTSCESCSGGKDRGGNRVSAQSSRFAGSRVVGRPLICNWKKRSQGHGQPRLDFIHCTMSSVWPRQSYWPSPSSFSYLWHEDNDIYLTD